jgi:hypothetical protein
VHWRAGNKRRERRKKREMAVGVRQERETKQKPKDP